MPWYYANAGQQTGPLTDEDFERLIREGAIQPATLVWQEGMANWQPLSSVRPAPSAPPPETPPAGEPAAATPGQVICHECRKSVPAEDTLLMGGATICSACKPIYVQRLREGTNPLGTQPGEYRYGGFWIRLLAKLIDGFIVAIPIGLLVLLAMFGFGTSFINQGGPQSLGASFGMIALQVTLQVVVTGISVIYNVFFLYKYDGATPGKMACKLRVINADGSKLSLGKCFGRCLAEIVSGMTCDIGYIIAGFDAQKRSLHDHICNTRVIYK